MEASLADSRRLTDDAREKSAYKERALQDRLRDLDEQLSNSRAEAAKARRDKEELERKFNSKLYDLKVRITFLVSDSLVLTIYCLTAYY